MFKSVTIDMERLINIYVRNRLFFSSTQLLLKIWLFKVGYQNFNVFEFPTVVVW